jgi:hypothetical protein
MGRLGKPKASHVSEMYKTADTMEKVKKMAKLLDDEAEVCASGASVEPAEKNEKKKPERSMRSIKRREN